MSHLWRLILPRSRPPFHSWIITAARTPIGPHPPLTTSPPFHLSLRLLHVGQSASLVRSFTSRDLEMFSELTGDTNPIHVDPACLSTSSPASGSTSSPFTSPVVHGVLVNGLVSAVLGTKLPGPGSVLLRQDIRFPAPLYLGEEVQALATVRKVKMNLAFITVRCSVQRDEKVVMEGEVIVRMP